MSVRRAFVDGPFGQIHLRHSPSVAGRRPLVCLHATAYSSQSFLPLIDAIGARRQVIAIDAPGYGDSDPPPAGSTIADHAMAMEQAIPTIATGPVDLLGYHTGAYIATELAVRAPALVDRLVLIGIPYFRALDHAAWRARLATPHRLEEGLNQFEERWSYLVANRLPGVPLARAFANFVDELRAWPNGWWAHAAMFDHADEMRLPLVRQPVLVINPDGHLNHPSRVAAGLMHDAALEEWNGVGGPVLEVQPDRVAASIERFCG